MILLSAQRYHLRVSSHTITARPAATTKAIPLAHTGTLTPCTVTSQPKMSRNNCSMAISARRTIAMTVKGFFIFWASVGEGPTGFRRDPRTPLPSRRVLPLVRARKQRLWLYKIGSRARSRQCREIKTPGHRFDCRCVKPDLYPPRVQGASGIPLNLVEPPRPSAYLVLQCTCPQPVQSPTYRRRTRSLRRIRGRQVMPDR